MSELQNIELSKLKESKTNPRYIFEKNSMADLVSSIKEQGIVTPLLVRPQQKEFEIIAGARRFRAATVLKLETVPCVVRLLNDAEALELQIIENDQRVDVHPMEQCAGYLQLQKKCNFTVEQLAQHVGKSVSYVAKRLKYVDLIEPIRKLFLENKISATHAYIAARLQPEQQKEIVKLKWLDSGDSAAEFARDVENHFFLVLKDAPFDTKDAMLVPPAGSCVDCPKRTGFNKSLFEDIKNEDTCTDHVCFVEKSVAFINRQIATHKGATLLSICSFYESKAKHETKWVKAGDKNCPDVKKGLVVEVIDRYPEDNQKAKLGAVINICMNPKCKIHHPAAPKSDYDAQTGRSKSADKARKIELRRRGLVFNELSSNAFPVSDKDSRAVLDYMIRVLGSDEARSVCHAMEWEIGKGKFVGKDYHGTIEKNLAKLAPKAVGQWILLMMLAGSDLWFYAGGKAKTALLDDKAKQEGVPLAALAKLSKEKKKAAPKPKDKKTKAA
jgi:ParB family chromosome partitioning protein